MGSPKPLLPWLGSTLVVRQTEALLDAGTEIVCVVTGNFGGAVSEAVAGSDKIAHATLKLERRVLMTPSLRYKEGKTFSILAGLAVLPPRVSMIALLAVDQPRPAVVIEKVLTSHVRSGRPLTSPRFDGHGGHPLVFSATLRRELESITEQNEGIREVMRRHGHEINWVQFDDPVVRLDLNTPEAYKAALINSVAQDSSKATQ